jgi:hypothetical protein
MNFCIHFVLLVSTQTMASTGRGPPKNRTKDKRKQRVVSWNDEMTMADNNLKAMSVPPERPAGESSAVVPFPGSPFMRRQFGHSQKGGNHASLLAYF